MIGSCGCDLCLQLGLTVAVVIGSRSVAPVQIWVTEMGTEMCSIFLGYPVMRNVLESQSNCANALPPILAKQKDKTLSDPRQ